MVQPNSTGCPRNELGIFSSQEEFQCPFGTSHVIQLAFHDVRVNGPSQLVACPLDVQVFVPVQRLFVVILHDGDGWIIDREDGSINPHSMPPSIKNRKKLTHTLFA